MPKVGDFLRNLATQLDAAEAPPPPAPTEPRYLSVPTYAKRAGVSAETVRRWIKDGLPHTNAPGRVRVIVAQADIWVEKGPGAVRAGAGQGLTVLAGGRL